MTAARRLRDGREEFARCRSLRSMWGIHLREGSRQAVRAPRRTAEADPAFGPLPASSILPPPPSREPAAAQSAAAKPTAACSTAARATRGRGCYQPPRHGGETHTRGLRAARDALPVFLVPPCPDGSGGPLNSSREAGWSMPAGRTRASGAPGRTLATISSPEDTALTKLASPETSSDL